MVSHLTGQGHGAPDVSGPLGSEVGDTAAVLAVLVGQQLDSPPLGGSLESLAGGDGDDVDEGALGGEIGHRDLFAEDALRVIDALLHGLASADPELHQVGDLLGHAGHELGLGVGEDADVLDVEAVELGVVGLSFLGHIDPPVEERVDVRFLCPDLAGGLQAEDGVLVEPDGGDLHRRDLDDGHGHLDLHSGGGALRAFVDDERVGHTGLVAGESLDLGRAGDLGPAVQPGHLRLCSLPRAVCPGTLCWASCLRHISTYLRGYLR